jgi:hypothetical protein
MMDTFQTLGDNDETEHSDGDSQRNIIKETEYTVTSTAVAGSGDNAKKDTVLGWEHNGSIRV